MSAGDITQGRRVDTLDQVERAGDYYGPTDEVDSEDNVIGRGVWFLLPIHKGATKFDRPTEGSGLHRVSELPWRFRECGDGSLEIRESILSGRSAERPNGYWHGYLDCGHVWREV